MIFNVGTLLHMRLKAMSHDKLRIRYSLTTQIAMFRFRSNIGDLCSANHRSFTVQLDKNEVRLAHP